MALTPEQLTALKADIAVNTATTDQYPGLQIKDMPLANSDYAFAIARWYSGLASPEFNVLRSDVTITEIYDAITWANFTPSDTPDNSTTYQNRAILCQTKQMNLQLLLQGRDYLNAAKINIRAGLNDATTNIPSGTNGASRSGGWSNILPILRRAANRVEKLFAVQTSGVGVNAGDALGATTNPALMTFEGSISYQELQA